MQNRKSLELDAGAAGKATAVATSTGKALEKLRVPPTKVLKKADNTVTPFYCVRIP